MFSSLMFFVAIIIFLFAVILMYKLFGKNGLYIFIAFATILANIQVSKNIVIFSLTTTCGNVLYAANFLCTDILSEKYGKKAAQKAVFMGIMITILWIIGTQFTLLIKPAESDIMQEHMKSLFGVVPRICIASLIGYSISQFIDVKLYHLIWDKSGNSSRFLWLRNNGSTLVSQMVDTILFVGIAFIGVYSWDVFFSILFTTYLFKAIVALFDTPFIYIARTVKTIGDDDLIKEQE